MNNNEINLLLNIDIESSDTALLEYAFDKLNLIFGLGQSIELDQLTKIVDKIDDIRDEIFIRKIKAGY